MQASNGDSLPSHVSYTNGGRGPNKSAKKKETDRTKDQTDQDVLIVAISPYTDEEFETIQARKEALGPQGRRYHIITAPISYTRLMSSRLRDERALAIDLPVIEQRFPNEV